MQLDQHDVSLIGGFLDVRQPQGQPHIQNDLHRELAAWQRPKAVALPFFQLFLDFRIPFSVNRGIAGFSVWLTSDDIPAFPPPVLSLVNVFTFSSHPGTYLPSDDHDSDGFSPNFSCDFAVPKGVLLTWEAEQPDF